MIRNEEVQAPVKYGLGVLVFAHNFYRANPDWSSRLGEMAVYSLAWPATLAIEIAVAVRSLF